MMPRSVSPSGAAALTAPDDESGSKESQQGIVDDLNLPDGFWEARDVLSKIRDAAHSRMVSPDATLLSVLARYAAVVPASYRVPPIVGSEGTLDFIGCAVASSSGGKSVANHVAADLFPVQRKDILMDLPVGSGEGLIQSFLVDELDDDGKKTGRQIVGMAAVHFTVDEGTALMEQQARRGTTIVQTLCSAWSGATLGQANASAETRRIIQAKRVRVSAVINIQTSNGHLLLDERMVAIGLPQRIVFASAHSELPPLETLPSWPGQLDLPVPPNFVGQVTELMYDAQIVQELREARYAVATGQVVLGPVDGHLGLARTKVAGILALMDDRIDVSIDDWDLAGQIISSSTAVRGRLIQVKKITDSERVAAQGALQAQRELVSEDLKTRQKVTRLANRIARYVEDGPLIMGDVRKKFDKDERKKFQWSLDKDSDDEAVLVVDIEHNGQPGQEVRKA